MVFLSRKPKGIARVLAEAGGSGLLVFAFFANLGEGYATARIASDGGNMLDAIVARDFGATRGNFFAILAFIGLLAVSIFLKDSLLGQYLENGMARLRKKTVESLGKTRMSWLDGHHTGQLSARVMADLAALSGALRPVLIMGISVVVYNCVALAFMFMTDWLLTLIVFSIAPATALLQWFSSHPIREYRKANQEAVGALSSVVFDCFGNFESVKSLALEDEMRGRFNAAQERQVDAAVKETRVIAGLTVFSGIGTFLPRLALLLAGGIFIINGRMTLGQLSMFIYLSGGVVRVVGNMANLIGSIRQLTANADRIVALWDAPKEKSGGFSEAPAALSGADCGAAAPFPETAIRFENVSFKYGDGADSGANCGADDGADDILADVSFDVPKGAFVALVGESGCGKSTAMKLAAALYEPKKGSIRELGRDIGEWDVSALRSRIAYVAQDAYLFPVSLADNIRAGSPAGEGPEAGASLEECVKIAQLARFAESLPKGLETNAGERGVFLSGGQKQRISIARALYKKAELLFLDEATSALDRATEEAVLRGILSMKDRPTLVAITHSLANVRNADKIIVFSGGRTRETGTHDVLLARNGEYARLLARQESRIEA